MRISRKPYNLLRSFSALSLLSIVLIGIVSAALLSRFLRETLLEQNGLLTLEFVQSIAQSQNTSRYFSEPDPAKRQGPLDDFFKRIAHMPDVVRANVYSLDRVVLWSTEKPLAGRQFPENNPELDRALNGQLALHTGQVKAHDKSEHILFRSRDQGVCRELYPHSWARRCGGRVVELYKLPRLLWETIARGQRLVWVSAGLGGLFLYAMLFWIVRRASRTITDQQQALIEAEQWATVGELAAAVAHSLRNPLAAIRSSAELAAEGEAAGTRECLGDIAAQVDRMETWIRELLLYSHQPEGNAQGADLNETLRHSVADFRDRCVRQGVALHIVLPEWSPRVCADPHLLGQVFNSLLANALEAMPNGGQLQVTAEPRNHRVTVTLSDTGTGLSPEQLAEAFKPFVSHKRHGLGVGLALARRIVQRYGGRLELCSQPGAGATALLQLPLAE
ncbi:MAG: two-component sensor histidine kinase [Gammaproteobacteria bacterium]|nr:two-component sensor histidine kinase [Gammaproteobacteria bacterium]